MLLMTGLYCVCPLLGHLPGITMAVFSVGFALCGEWLSSVVCTLYGYGSVKAQRAHLTHRSADRKAFGGRVAIMAVGRSPVHSLKC